MSPSPFHVTAGTPEPASIPRELVLASAGSGKTFHISSRIIGLLDAGVSPDEILASTFTRKAAGEILDRVLVRLAHGSSDPERARELTARTALVDAESSGTAGLPPVERWRLRLRELVRNLHRTNVSTLDGFFVRTARAFPLEMGLPPGWTIADELTARRHRSEALEAILTRTDGRALVELVRMLVRGEATRRVHDRLVEQVSELLDVHRQVAPDAEAPWRPFGRGDGRPGEEERDRLATAVDGVESPKNKDGSEDRRWAPALESVAEAIREGAWEEVFGTGLGGKLLEGDSTYYSKPFPPTLVSALEEARSLARMELAHEYDEQAKAMGRLAEEFEEAFARIQRRDGAYRFGDVTHRLARPDAREETEPITLRPDLYYRLDQRTRHLLLDEFQDTSLPQWEAIRPLAEELLSGHRHERAAVIVADPKQSIYGWRGADPALVRRVGERFVLNRKTLAKSWRSSPVVLGLVNDVFRDLASNPALDPGDRETAEEWATDFEEHEAQHDRPGHVRIAAGPRDRGRGSDRPLLMAETADRVRSLVEEAPGFGIGVLTSRNATVTRLIHELRIRGVDASEEGGTALVDSPAVAALLALLRLADHPGDTVARYHVAMTPVGEVVGYADHRDGPGARRVGARIRDRLVRRGYGETLTGWTRALADACGHRDFRRLSQLVELGFRWDEGPTLRPTDFVRFVESERVEDPTGAQVRVMTVHQAKGLEFDIVVLPELDRKLVGGGGPGDFVALPERDPENGRIVRVFPYIRKALRPLFPEVEIAARQARAARLRDSLGVLYVGMTRARHALHLVIAADDEGGDPDGGGTPAWLIRSALELDDVPAEAGRDLLERGDPNWHRSAEPGVEPPPPLEPPGGEPTEVRFAESERRRILARRVPSRPGEGEEVDLAKHLGLDRSDARLRGTVIHRWLEELRWIEDGIPGRDELVGRVAPGYPGVGDEELRRWAGEFRDWLGRPGIREVLSRERFPVGSRVEMEIPFARRSGDELVTGVIDRLVVIESGDAVTRAEVVDFKTDVIDGDRVPDEALVRYRPQMEAYRESVSATRGIPPERVAALLVFLAAGEVFSI